MGRASAHGGAPCLKVQSKNNPKPSTGMTQQHDSNAWGARQLAADPPCFSRSKGHGEGRLSQESFSRLHSSGIRNANFSGELHPFQGDKYQSEAIKVAWLKKVLGTTCAALDSTTEVMQAWYVVDLSKPLYRNQFGCSFRVHPCRIAKEQ